MRIDNNNEETLYTSPHSTNQHGPLLLAFLPRKNGHSQTTISSYRRRFYRSSMVIVRYQSVISYSFLFFFPPNYSVHKSGGCCRLCGGVCFVALYALHSVCIHWTQGRVTPESFHWPPKVFSLPLSHIERVVC